MYSEVFEQRLQGVRTPYCILFWKTSIVSSLECSPRVRHPCIEGAIGAFSRSRTHRSRFPHVLLHWIFFKIFRTRPPEQGFAYDTEHTANLLVQLLSADGTKTRRDKVAEYYYVVVKCCVLYNVQTVSRLCCEYLAQVPQRLLGVYFIHGTVEWGQWHSYEQHLAVMS